MQKNPWLTWLRNQQTRLASSLTVGRKRSVSSPHKPLFDDLEDRVVPAIYNVIDTVDDATATVTMIGADEFNVGSLRRAIIEANASTGVDDVINLQAGTYLLDLTGTNEDAAATGDLDIAPDGGNLTINGVSAATTFVDGNLTDRVFHVVTGTTATV